MIETYVDGSSTEKIDYAKSNFLNYIGTSETTIDTDIINALDPIVEELKGITPIINSDGTTF